MAEKVARTGVRREKDFMYYVKDGAVWKVPRKQAGMPKGKASKVVDAGVKMDFSYIYFVDKDGDVARAKRAVGGQKRKKKAAAPKAKAKAKAKAAPKKAKAKAAPKKAKAKAAPKKAKAKAAPKKAKAKAKPAAKKKKR